MANIVYVLRLDRRGEEPIDLHTCRRFVVNRPETPSEWDRFRPTLREFYRTRDGRWICHLAHPGEAGTERYFFTPDCTAASYLFYFNHGCNGFDLRLISSLSDVSGIPRSGTNLIIVAAVDNVLHFRSFDGDGKVVVDMDETRLTTQAGLIEDLKGQLDSLWPPHELNSSEKDRVIAAVTSIVGHTRYNLPDEIERLRHLFSPECKQAIKIHQIQSSFFHAYAAEEFADYIRSCDEALALGMSGPLVAVEGRRCDGPSVVVGAIEPCENGSPVPPLPEPRPRWDSMSRTLFLGDTACRVFPREAPNLFKILDTFELQGWETPIKSPFTDEVQLRQTIKDFNKRGRGCALRLRQDRLRVSWFLDTGWDRP